MTGNERMEWVVAQWSHKCILSMDKAVRVHNLESWVPNPEERNATALAQKKLCPECVVKELSRCSKHANLFDVYDGASCPTCELNKAIVRERRWNRRFISRPLFEMTTNGVLMATGVVNAVEGVIRKSWDSLK